MVARTAELAHANESLRRLARCDVLTEQPDPTACPLMLSVGGSIASVEQVSEDDAVLAADNALYLAQSQGRNQVQRASRASAAPLPHGRQFSPR